MTTASLRIVAYAIVIAFAFALGAFSRPALVRWKEQLATTMGWKTPDDGPTDPSRYERKNSQYGGLPNARKIVFLGDSRVENAEWSELFGRSDIANRGISGDTTAGVLRRLSSAAPEEGGLCVIQLGVNDLARGVSVDSVVGNFRKILEHLRVEKRARVIVTSIILVGEDQPEMNATISHCNRDLAALAASLGAQWVDVNAPLCPGGFLPAEVSNDGLHLNGEGYRRMRDALLPLL